MISYLYNTVVLTGLLIWRWNENVLNTLRTFLHRAGQRLELKRISGRIDSERRRSPLAMGMPIASHSKQPC